MNIEKELLEQAAREVAADIDFGLMADLMKDAGWVEVEFEAMMPASVATDIKAWMDKNCTDHRMARKSRFLFKSKVDAVNFTLRWK